MKTALAILSLALLGACGVDPEQPLCLYPIAPGICQECPPLLHPHSYCVWPWRQCLDESKVKSSCEIMRAAE